ncbi:MAG: FecR domain-containing protein [Reichenbachiella sp.]|uniref:FecR family protein n=1 Tax=Reichenbachiella sp. TaxID=2184521 RepID=UPI00326612FE
MEKYQSDETFLARWAAGELSPEELAEFEQSEAFKDFERINQESQKFSAPPINKENSLIEVNEKIVFDKKRRTLARWAIAASVSVLVTASTLLFSSKTYTTSYGEQLSIVLPDGSKVRLNAESKLSHKRFFWLNDKKVNLEGEGFFIVEKGDGFRVATSYGITSVLGTKFNIRARPKRFTVDCFEGKVEYVGPSVSDHYILEAGTGLQISDGKVEGTNPDIGLPSWMNGISIFKDATLSEVIDEIQIQYGVAFETNNKNLSGLFSGSFIHSDLDKALRSTLVPMGINYQLDAAEWVVRLQ